MICQVMVVFGCKVAEIAVVALMFSPDVPLNVAALDCLVLALVALVTPLQSVPISCHYLRGSLDSVVGILGPNSIENVWLETFGLQIT